MVNRTRIFFALLVTLFVGLTFSLLHAQLPKNTSIWLVFQYSNNLELLLVQSYILPRIAMALLAGGTLAFASLLLQQVMSNPLASDNTLGISSGSQMTLFLATIFAPQWLEMGASFIALVGAGLSLLLVMSLAMRKTMSPLLLILAGLVVNLYFGSFTGMMMLFYPEESRGLALWGAGSLVQESWRDSQLLSLQSTVCFAIVFALIRPSVVSKVGMLGFVGLAAATIIRQMGIRTLKWQLIGSFAMGALVLAITDLILQFINLYYQISLPTGAVTALLGTPLLLWLMFKALPNTGRLTENSLQKSRQYRPLFTIFIIVLLAISVMLALFVGKMQFYPYIKITTFDNAFNLELLELRYPRIFIAICAGILLSVAGVLLQRLTLNPMASPELLGVSSGASMGILVLLFVFPTQQTILFWISGIVGAFIALAILAAINQRNGMLPEKILLTGISLSALFDTAQRLAIASGDPRANQLISWTSGSTQNTDPKLAVPFFILSLGLLLISLIFSRWLELLSLQAPIAKALGLNLKLTRWILILFSAALTAIAILMIGPLSFIGLLVPHLTNFLGVHKAKNQLLISALLGTTIMVLADWVGRQVLFPYEIPAGLIATLLGGSYFLVMMRKI